MKILFLNGSRGEWGYIRPIIDLCIERGVDYDICATNMLSLPNFGNLVSEIRNDGYQVSDEIYMSLDGYNHYTMAKSLGIFLTSFVDVLHRIKPTWLVLAGDRGEQFMGAVAASYTYTPVAHIQAGERSGNIDGVVRHSITKLVHMHFAANEDAATRLHKLGEEDFRIHNVGAPQLDELANGKISSHDELCNKYKDLKGKKFLLVVQHPVTEDMYHASEQVNALTASLNKFDLPKVWVMPNNDAGSLMIRNSILQARDSNSLIFDNLPREDYLGLLENCECIIGNSSSGVLEAPTLKTPAINLGRRQNDRVQGINVINAEYEVGAITDAINKAISDEFKMKMKKCVNPYGDGQSSARILDLLNSIKIDDTLLTKKITY